MTTQLNYKNWNEAEHELLGDDYYSLSPETRSLTTSNMLDDMIYDNIKIKINGYSYTYE